MSGSWEACGDQANLHACSPWDTCPAAAVAEEAVAVAAPECNDPVAFNYNASATSDAGCVPVMLGCTDPTAVNFNATVNTDDGSCVPGTPGCTDPSAQNYNASLGYEILTEI